MALSSDFFGSHAEGSDRSNNADAWHRAFSAKTREEQMNDDTAALSAVTGIILTIVSIGLVLAIASVLLSG